MYPIILVWQLDIVAFAVGPPANGINSLYEMHRINRTHHSSNPFGGALWYLCSYSATASWNDLLCLFSFLSHSASACSINLYTGCRPFGLTSNNPSERNKWDCSG